MNNHSAVFEFYMRTGGEINRHGKARGEVFATVCCESAKIEVKFLSKLFAW